MVNTIACVLRSGGDYTQQHVSALKKQLNGYALTCLTDIPEEKRKDIPGVIWEPMAERWPGWWSKIELFRPSLFCGSVLYFDLDTFIIGDISPLLSMYVKADLWMLHDLGQAYEKLQANSGVMMWKPGDLSEQIYSHFKQAGHKNRLSYTDKNEGDGNYINDQAFSRIKFLQNKYPSWFVSYKWGAREAVPEGARVVCFHGKPRPWQVKDGWAKQHWDKHSQ